MNPFQGRAIWAFSWKMQAERDAASIAKTCRAYGIMALQQEAAYGVVWQGTIDGLSPASLDALGRLHDDLAAEGIALVPVVVPRGLIGQGEAEMHAAIGRVCGALVVDLECDASGDYWPVSEINLISVYAKALRDAAGPDVLIGWQPDGRLADTSREHEFQLVVSDPVAAGRVDVLCPQLYAGAVSPWNYGGGMMTVNKDIARFGRFAALGCAMVPTLYIADSMSEPAALWAAVADRSIGMVGFRLGAADAPRLAVFAALPLAVTPDPKPAPTPKPVPNPAAALLRITADGLIDLSIRAAVQAKAVQAAAESLERTPTMDKDFILSPERPHGAVDKDQMVRAFAGALDYNDIPHTLQPAPIPLDAAPAVDAETEQRLEALQQSDETRAAEIADLTRRLTLIEGRPAPAPTSSGFLALLLTPHRWLPALTVIGSIAGMAASLYAGDQQLAGVFGLIAGGVTAIIKAVGGAETVAATKAGAVVATAREQTAATVAAARVAATSRQ